MNKIPEPNTVVLVVDDSPESLGMLNIALGQAGFTVLVALNGPQSLSIIDKVEPDVILLDAVMPEMDGFTTCKKIKEKLPNTPVIFMTGLSDLEHIVAGFDSGRVDYVTKPITPDEVIARIKVHVVNARMTNSARAALDTTGQHIFSIDDRGHILWATRQAQNLFASDPPVTDMLPAFTQALAEWVAQDQHTDLVFDQFKDKVRVVYIGQQNSHEHLVKIMVQAVEPSADLLLEKLPLTKREAEVLLWVSLGKTNWEIGQILKISPRTVNKHLEQVYKKMQVDNRTAAAALAIKILNNS